MIKVVPDTNALIRGFLSHRNDQRQILNLAIAKKIVLYGTESTYEEFCEKVRESRLQGWLHDQLFSSQKIISDYKALVNLVDCSSIYPGVSISRDSDDDVFFRVAAASGSKIIVSEDSDLLVVKNYEGIRVIKTAPFLEIYKKANGGMLYRI